MENFKKKQIRLGAVFAVGLMLLVGIYLFFYQMNPLRLPPRPSMQVSMMRGASFGCIIGYVIVGIWYLVRTIRAWRNPDVLEKMYIRQNDERNIYIGWKTGSTTIQISILLLVFAMDVASALSMTVFFTLYGVLCAVLILNFSCNLYYRKKF